MHIIELSAPSENQSTADRLVDRLLYEAKTHVITKLERDRRSDETASAIAHAGQLAKDLHEVRQLLHEARQALAVSEEQREKITVMHDRWNLRSQALEVELRYMVNIGEAFSTVSLVGLRGNEKKITGDFLKTIVKQTRYAKQCLKTRVLGADLANER